MACLWSMVFLACNAGVFSRSLLMTRFGAAALVRSPRSHPVRLAGWVRGVLHEDDSQRSIPRGGLRRRVGRIVRRERRTLRTRGRRHAFLAPRKMNAGHGSLLDDALQIRRAIMEAARNAVDRSAT